MRYKATALALILALLSIILVPATLLQAQTTTPATSSLAVPINGTVRAANGALTTLTGNFNIKQFTVQNGALLAVGTLVGTLKNTATGAVKNIVAPIALPVASLSGTCDILHLTLGPLDLNLLGLVVHLNQVVLDITAQSGAGQLLGNLLCSVANLLNGGLSGVLQQVADLLNQILAAL